MQIRQPLRPLRIPEPDWQMRGALIAADLREQLVATLELSQPSAWSEILTSAIGAHGGALIPTSGTGWGPHWWQLSLLGVSGTGATLEEAAREWARCSRRMRTALEDAA